MRLLTTDTNHEVFVGGYGPDSRTVVGVLSEHADLFARAGGVIRDAASGSGAQWAVIDGKAYPIVCSEVIQVWTEDGPATGRCGGMAVKYGSCAAHAESIAEYLATSEAERAYAERYGN